MKKLKIPFNAGATTESVGETSNLRAQDLRSFNAKNSTLSRITRRCFRIYFVAGLRPIKTKKQHPFRFFFMKSARRVAVILWMTLLCRSNDRAGRRDFEPSSPGLGSFNAKKQHPFRMLFFCIKKARDGDRTRKWQFFGFPLFIAIPLFIGIVAIYVIIVNSIKIGVLG